MNEHHELVQRLSPLLSAEQIAHDMQPTKQLHLKIAHIEYAKQHMLRNPSAVWGHGMLSANMYEMSVQWDTHIQEIILLMQTNISEFDGSVGNIENLCGTILGTIINNTSQFEAGELKTKINQDIEETLAQYYPTVQTLDIHTKRHICNEIQSIIEDKLFPVALKIQDIDEQSNGYEYPDQYFSLEELTNPDENFHTKWRKEIDKAL